MLVMGGVERELLWGTGDASFWELTEKDGAQVRGAWERLVGGRGLGEVVCVAK